jgi:hypothetical protein
LLGSRLFRADPIIGLKSCFGAAAPLHRAGILMRRAACYVRSSRRAEAQLQFMVAYFAAILRKVRQKILISCGQQIRE